MAGTGVSMSGLRRSSAASGVLLLATVTAVLCFAGYAPAWLVHASLSATSGWALCRALRAADRRGGWVLMAAALLCSSTSALLETHALLPEPVLGVLYVGTYVGLASALVVLLRGRVERWEATSLLDGATCGLGVGTVMTATLLSPLATHGVGGLASLYPLLDLLVLTALSALLAVCGWRVTGGLGLALLGVGLAAVGDASMAAQSAAGGVRPGHWSDGVWVLAFLCAALATGRPLVPGTPRRRVPHLAQLLLPLLWIVVCAVLRGLDRFHPFPLAVMVLTALTSSLAIGRMVLSVRDVQALAASRLEARTDPLTGLPNRRALYERLERDLGAGPCSLLILDLDGFTADNDSLGHHHGDALLVEIGPRLAPVLRGEGDLLARLGGDEFAVVLPGLAGPEAHAVALRLLAAL
ncbi:MAG: diguanylate cyclase domain-containing protein, partial [Mycobacteriales bacterium]